MKHVVIAIAPFLTACEAVTVEAAFKDVQRHPPRVSDDTAQIILTNDRPFAEWVAETRRKCERFRCVE